VQQEVPLRSPLRPPDLWFVDDGNSDATVVGSLQSFVKV